MATIRKRGKKWQAQIRREGLRPVSKSFILKSDAEEWARLKECQADRKDFQFDIQKLEQITWGELLKNYKNKIVSKKKCHKSEAAHINAYLNREADVAAFKVSQLKPHHFSDYRNKRLECVKPATVCRELGIFHHTFEIAKTEWGLPIAQNPVALVNKPKISNRRNRRLTALEYRVILKASQSCRNKCVEQIIRIAAHTGMRRGEILNIKIKHINFSKKTLFIPDTKTGQSRTIPLSPRILTLLKNYAPNDGGVFPISANALRLSWDRVLVRANITDLKFHDLRHEAISRFFERGLSIPEVALISGHRSYTMLQRYTHLRAEDVARKL